MTQLWRALANHRSRTWHERLKHSSKSNILRTRTLLLPNTSECYATNKTQAERCATMCGLWHELYVTTKCRRLPTRRAEIPDEPATCRMLEQQAVSNQVAEILRQTLVSMASDLYHDA